nr:BlaI/MecI/CopY family transcriptional regulator [Pleomorphovibrio marinus]
MTNKPTAAELEILQVLWSEGEASVREVHEILAVNKDTGYTTTLKLMQNMHSKGFLAREEEGRSHIYRPLINESDTQNSLVRTFMSATFGGSSKKLVMKALGQSNPSKEEIKEIRKFLDQLENNPKP